MGKTSKSETKKAKTLETYKSKKKRWASKERRTKDISGKKSSNHSKIFKMFNLFSEPSIEDLIKSLDSPIKNAFINNNFSNLEISFPSDITNRKFCELFLKGLNLAKRNFNSNNLIILKKLLLLLNDSVKGKDTLGDEFGLGSCSNNFQKVFRKDLLLTLLSDESKIQELGKEGLDKVENKFKLTNEYNLFVENSVYNQSIVYNENNNGLYSFQQIKNILFSPVVLQAYIEVLEELYGVKKSRQEIKQITKEFLKKQSIYFVPMNFDHYGMILYDGTILINRTYYGISYSHKNAIIILFTLMHEIMHALSRLLRGNTNYFLNTGEFTKAHNKIFVDESGNYFENKLLFNVLKGKQLTSIEAEYLLDPKHYEYETLADFKKAFSSFRTQNKQKINASTPFAIGKGSNDDIVYINNGCYCAGSRNNYI
jgi:hypothetical protein